MLCSCLWCPVVAADSRSCDCDFCCSRYISPLFTSDVYLTSLWFENWIYFLHVISSQVLEAGEPCFDLWLCTRDLRWRINLQCDVSLDLSTFVLQKISHSFRLLCKINDKNSRASPSILSLKRISEAGVSWTLGGFSLVMALLTSLEYSDRNQRGIISP